MFSYNNMAVGLEGRVVEAAAGKPYRDFVTGLLLQPLGLTRTSFFTEDIVDYPVAAGHLPGSDGPHVQRPAGGGIYSAAVAPIGGLFSTVDDLLQWAAFHLADGHSGHGVTVAAPETLRRMQQIIGPGGGLGTDDMDGVGINWLLRSANGLHVIEHGGTAPAQRSQFVMLPERDFAFVLLTNSTGGSLLRKELTPWVLEHYVGIREPSRPAIAVPPDRFAEYAGDFGVRGLGSAHRILNTPGGLVIQHFGEDSSSLDPNQYHMRFYAPDRVVLEGGAEEGNLLDFLRSDDGPVSWVRANGRVFERV